MKHSTSPSVTTTGNVFGELSQDIPLEGNAFVVDQPKKWLSLLYKYGYTGCILPVSIVIRKDDGTLKKSLDRKVLVTSATKEEIHKIGVLEYTRP